MKDENYTPGNATLGARFDASARPIVRVDVMKYQTYLDESGLSEAQKSEFLEALWSIIVNFVDLGFGVHPLQEACGQSENNGVERPKDAFDQVRSGDTIETSTSIESGPESGLEAR